MNDSTEITKKEQTILEAINISKTFGDVCALDNVSLRLQKGSFHALLGENGAGKSTLVKCLMGYYQPDHGAMLYKDREIAIHNPEQATAVGIGMVYQHFTLIPNMTVAENLVLARPHLPFRIQWKQEIAGLKAKMQRMPFAVPLDKNVSHLSAGEKQKVEIIKQLMLDTSILFLDEPTSVLTPQEADEVLGKIHRLTRESDLTVLIITHKFREVMQFADQATVLRKGKWVASTAVAETDPKQLAEMMVGSEIKIDIPVRSASTTQRTVLEVNQLQVQDDAGMTAVHDASLSVSAGEIVGIAGVSGNGQREFVEALAGQRSIEAGGIKIDGHGFHAKRREMRKFGFFCLPEEPLRNAGVPSMSIADNLALRTFDTTPFSRFKCLLNRRAMKKNARQKIAEYKVRTYGPEQWLGDLSGGNVQRVILARELSQQMNVLVVSNPCFGLDFKAVTEIRARIIEARNKGAVVLLFSEDLDEILELSDRILVISSGHFVHETTPQTADLNTIGRYMAGH